MDGGVQPLDPNVRLVGQARTVRCTVGDNSALHAALDLVEPGDVLVADAGGFLGKRGLGRPDDRSGATQGNCRARH